MHPTEIAGIPTDQRALEPIRRFLTSVASRDLNGLKQVVTPEGWDASENGVQSLANQIAKKGLKVQPLLVGKINNKRASVRAILTHEDRTDWVQALWFLMEERDQWLIAGATKSRPLVGLFLQARFSTEMTAATYPEDLEFGEWSGNQSEDFWTQCLEPYGMAVSIASQWAGTRVRRAIRVESRGLVILENSAKPTGVDPATVSLVLETDENENWKPVDAKRQISIESLVAGLDIPWSPKEKEEDEHE